MNEIASGMPVPNLRRLPLKRSDLELNNNKSAAVPGVICKDTDGYSQDNINAHLKKKYNHNSSSASASGSDISIDEDLEAEVADDSQQKLQEGDKHVNGESEGESPTVNKQDSPDGTRRIRSMSDGAPIMNGFNPDGEPFEVFPSLPDSVLEKLELNGHRTNKERLHEDELEQKFVSLSLAFTIDATTIEHRCERQRRCRDQTENNLNAEIERLVVKAHRLRPLCVDAETTELLTGLLNQVDVIVQAAEHAAIAAERYGAVQHEARLADSAQLMITHVNALKQQRDSARRQLVYTRRVLQDTSQPATDVHKHGRHGSHGSVGFHATPGNARMITKRRASIATLPHQDLINHADIRTPDIRKITRRTSELSIRGGNLLQRSIRAPRLDLSLDLVKIRENSVEHHHAQESTLSEEAEEDVVEEPRSRNSFSSESHPSLEEEILEVEVKSSENGQKNELCTLQFKHKVTYVLKKLIRNFGNSLTSWLEEGAQGRFFYYCALICFTLGVISLGNALVEMQIERGGNFLHWL